MWDRKQHTWIAVFLSNVFVHAVIAVPIYIPQFLPGGTGRNIRHLPCVSRRTGETGVCMFAFTCAKANGTHLGTCIDRFYFGSCCKIEEEPYVIPQDNSIDEEASTGTVPARPFVVATTHAAIESNDIPEYFSRPQPIVPEKKPPGTHSSEASSVTRVTETIRPSSTTSKQTTAILETTTPQSMRFTTFQTVQNGSEERLTTTITTSKNVTKTSSSGISQKPTTTPKISTIPSTQPYLETSKPTTKKPTHSSIVERPSQTTSRKPIETTSPKTVNATTVSTAPTAFITTTPTTPITTTQKIVPPTRFPPRNTTTSRPSSSQTITRKPSLTSSSKRPLITSTKRPTLSTKKPSSPTKRPTSPGKPSTISSSSSKPLFATTTIVTTTTKPHSTSTKVRPTIATTLANYSSSENAASSLLFVQATTTPINDDISTVDKESTTDYKTTTKPTTSRLTTIKPTTSRPVTSTTIKSKPTKVSSTTTKRTTTTTTTTSRPEISASTERITLVSLASGSTINATRPRPTRPSIRPSNRPSTKPSTRPSTRPSTKPLTKPTAKPSIATPPTTLASTLPSSSATLLSSDSTIAPAPLSTSTTTTTTTTSTTTTTTTTTTPAPYTGTTSQNASGVELSTLKTPPKNQTLEEVPQTTQPPSFVTWSSNSDEATTKTSEIVPTTNIDNEKAETEWTPITTPDGWIIIQSPTTETLPQTQEGSTVRPVAEATVSSATTVTPAIDSTTTTTTTEQAIRRTTIATLLSTIASVTVDAELPVPMETLNMSDYKQVCGRRLFRDSRIVGGSRSSFGKWPWQISLRQWRTSTYLHKCGAALLNENWAITAAHCVENVPPSDLLLRIGEHDLADEEEPYGFQERRVQIVASHPQFDPRTFEFDLALLRFYEPLLPFQPNVLPICLPDDDETHVGRTAYVTGWGRLYDEGPLPSVLQEVAVPVINNTICESMYRNAGYIEHIPHIFICAGWRNGGFDSCEGDSGGPMVIQRARDKRWILAGVISWGIGCAVPNQPGVYTRISEFREWINQILQF